MLYSIAHKALSTYANTHMQIPEKKQFTVSVRQIKFFQSIYGPLPWIRCSDPQYYLTDQNQAWVDNDLAPFYAPRVGITIVRANAGNQTKVALAR